MPLIDAVFTRLERLGLPVPRSLATFVCVGFIGLATHLSVLTAALHVGIGKPEAWLCGLVVATAVTWSLNRKVTFASSGRRGAAEVGRYALVTVVAQGVNFAVYMAVMRFEPRLPPQVAAFVGAMVGTIFSYTGQRFFTFAPQRASA